MALGARDLGVRTPRVRAFAVAEPNTLVLAYDAVAGRSLDRLAPEEITDRLLHDIWLSIGELRTHRIAHRDLRLANLFFGDDGQVWMIDFGFSEMAATDLLLANDVAELVASSSVVVGAERAASQALATVDDATLRRAVGRLQPWALSGATRTALKAQPGLIDDLRGRLLPSVTPTNAGLSGRWRRARRPGADRHRARRGRRGGCGRPHVHPADHHQEGADERHLEEADGQHGGDDGPDGGHQDDVPGREARPGGRDVAPQDRPGWLVPGRTRTAR